MSEKPGIYICLSLIVLLIAGTAQSQIYHDSHNLELAKKEVGLIYNMQFKEAASLHDQVASGYPGHPVVYLLKGISLYWENYPLMNNTPAGDSFEEAMKRCIDLSENRKDTSNQAEFLLASLCARGLMLLYLTENEESGKVFSLTVSTYPLVRKSFGHTGECADLYYFTGLYNYYREAYPRIFPVYKPLAALFPAGDMKTGLIELGKSGEGSAVMSADSWFMLAWIWLNFEKNYPKALEYSGMLHKQYPGNVLFCSEYIKDLLLLEMYDEAEKTISEYLVSTPSRYFRAQLHVYNGILYEKHMRNKSRAEQLYRQGITELEYFGNYGKPYAAYAGFGLSRIAAEKGNRELSRKLRRQAEKNADFKDINFD